MLFHKDTRKTALHGLGFGLTKIAVIYSRDMLLRIEKICYSRLLVKAYFVIA
jgi:hypothetical protein